MLTGYRRRPTRARQPREGDWKMKMREALPRLRLLVITGAFLAMASLTTASGAGANTLTVGNSPGANNVASFIPFGGLTQDLKNAIDNADGSEANPLPQPRFQQVYDSSTFSDFGPIQIDEIRFFASINQPDANPGLLGGTSCSDGRTECGLFTVQMSTTTLDVNMLSETDYLGNLQSGQQLFEESVLLTGSFAAGILSFSGTPYTYDPSQGNLIIDFQVLEFTTSTDLTQNLGRLFFDGTQDASDPVYSVADNYNGLDNSGFGLVTQFEYQLVPEPGTGLLLGLGLVGFGLRRRPTQR